MVKNLKNASHVAAVKNINAAAEKIRIKCGFAATNLIKTGQKNYLICTPKVRHFWGAYHSSVPVFFIPLV